MKLTIKGEVTRKRAVEHRGRYRNLDFTLHSEQHNNSYGLRLEHNDTFAFDFEVGDIIEVDFQIIGKTWNGKVINNLIVHTIRNIERNGSEREERRKKASKEFFENDNHRKPIKVDLHPK